MWRSHSCLSVGHLSGERWEDEGKRHKCLGLFLIIYQKKIRFWLAPTLFLKITVFTQTGVLRLYSLVWLSAKTPGVPLSSPLSPCIPLHLRQHLFTKRLSPHSLDLNPLTVHRRFGPLSSFFPGTHLTLKV